MPKKSKLDPADINIFKKAIKGVKPLIHNKIRLNSNHSQNHIKTRRSKQSEDELDLSETLDLPLVRGNEFISYKEPSISHKTLRKLNKGQYNVDAVLDLHGMTIDKAKKAVANFLQECLVEEVQVALIIHGKGLHSQMPILKNKLNQWLRSTNVVLAFCSASAIHGSQGAIYVLLRRAKEKPL